MLILDDIYVGESKTWAPLSRGMLRMSGAEQCTRRAGYSFMKTPEDVAGDPEAKILADFKAVVLEEGNMHERDIVRRLMNLGLEVTNFGTKQTWTKLKYKGLMWRGYPDLFVKTTDEETVGVEIKSTEIDLFNKYLPFADKIRPGVYSLPDQTVLHDAAFPYMGQIQLYLHSDKAVEMGIERWVLVLKERNNGAMLECVITKDQEYLDALSKRWKGFWMLVGAGRIPKRNFEQDTEQCRLCPFTKTCWATP